ncbi:MAG: hypothetical protein RMJ00_04435 [Nitrososphaerota archaeon]|nr:hypothetical protein [Candidatus Bathyarchaeota archaeon]MDW8061927.1 hypothetical protein [Nitrososphaerota archaeon]
MSKDDTLSSLEAIDEHLSKVKKVIVPENSSVLRYTIHMSQLDIVYPLSGVYDAFEI